MLASDALILKAVGRLLLQPHKAAAAWWWSLLRRYPSLRPLSSLLLLLALCRGGWLTVARLRSLSPITRSPSGNRSRKRGRAGTLHHASEDRLASLGESGMIAAFNTFYDLYKAGACCDATLVVGGSTFHAHKCVLAAASAPLRAMLEAGAEEGGSGGRSSSVVELSDVDAASFEAFLAFAYGRGVAVTRATAEPLLHLAARLGVPGLRAHCCAFLRAAAAERPGVDAAAALALADRYGCAELRGALLRLVLRHFAAACAPGAEGFLNLPPELVTEVIAHDGLCAPESAVFEACAAWAAARAERSGGSGSGAADALLAHVRFPLIGAAALAEAVEGHAMMQTQQGKARGVRGSHGPPRAPALPAALRRLRRACRRRRCRCRRYAHSCSSSCRCCGSGTGVTAAGGACAQRGARARCSAVWYRGGGRRGGAAAGGGAGGAVPPVAGAAARSVSHQGGAGAGNCT
ncbi:hypothetical protein JKP88DRAFT_267436 [Tribonema minus]|uniref:BTB domain-containing protein n=1 Tax=Tribonema minus TaxID=303371 RepID=A0A836CJI3_9STRA|nr:hypothetical protein JKP88DRAFT_267436 [Tribonema minus]